MKCGKGVRWGNKAYKRCTLPKAQSNASRWLDLLKENDHFSYKTRIRITIWWTLAAYVEKNWMRSPCRSKAPATTYTIFFIYAPFHLYMGKMISMEKKQIY